MNLRDLKDNWNFLKELLGSFGAVAVVALAALAAGVFYFSRFKKHLLQFRWMRRLVQRSLKSRANGRLNIILYEDAGENGTVFKEMLSNAMAYGGIAVTKIALPPISDQNSELEEKNQLAESQRLLEKYGYDIAVWGTLTTLSTSASIKLKWTFFNGARQAHLNHHEFSGTQAQLRHSLTSDLVGVVAATLYLHSLHQDSLMRRWIKSDALRLIAAGKEILSSVPLSAWTGYNRTAFELSLLALVGGLAQIQEDRKALQKVCRDLELIGSDDSLPRELRQQLLSTLGTVLMIICDTELSSELTGRAIDCFKDALTINADLALAEDPVLYVQLGNSLDLKARFVSHIEAAVLWREALVALSKAKTFFVSNPWNSAMVNVRICRVTAELALLGDQEALAELKPAIEDCRRAESTFRKMDAPAHSANACQNLGIALQFLFALTRDEDDCSESIAALRRAVALIPADTLLWAASNQQLANSLRALGAHKDNLSFLNEALDYYRRALGVYSSNNLSKDCVALELSVAQANVSAFNASTGIASKKHYADAAVSHFRDLITTYLASCTESQLGLAHFALAELKDFQARLNLDLRSRDEARQYCLKSIEYFKTAGDHNMESDAVALLKSFSGSLN